MHELNVLILGPPSFTSTLDELKSFLKFNSLTINFNKQYDVILFHNEALNDKKQKEIIYNSKAIKICAAGKSFLLNNFDANLELPTTIKEINGVVESIAAKNLIKISSIKVKDYLLNKNEKKLFRSAEFVILTEKEIQLLELFLSNKKPISKDTILSSVWNYSVEADTHTVETHIYRLRKKIFEKFTDENFILNNKNGYYL